MKILIAWAIDCVTSKVLPMYFYGQTNLTMWPDMIIKKFTSLALTCLLVKSTRFEKAMESIFRPQLNRVKAN